MTDGKVADRAFRSLMFLRRICIPIFLFLLFYPSSSFQAATLGPRVLTPMTKDQVSQLLNARDPLQNLDPANPNSHLFKILIPRPPETENNTLVRNYIASTLQALGWHVELDEFTANTPYGTKRMANVIATKDPSASRRVVLSAHFDSKFFPTYPANQFVGATDSAMSCALMLDLAETLNPLLDARKERLESSDDDDDDAEALTLQLVFFDGEEAFKFWTDEDSIYGAKHLAEKWASSYIWAPQKRHLMGLQQTQLDTIEHLILLDLLGAASPTIRSFFLDTAWLFDSLANCERRLGESGIFKYGDEMAPGKWQSWFVPRREGESNLGYIGDDHTPFLRRGISILHLISEPFPRVWHTLQDDASALDLPTMRRWNIIFRVFFSEYLQLQPQDFVTRSSVARSASEL